MAIDYEESQRKMGYYMITRGPEEYDGDLISLYS